MGIVVKLLLKKLLAKGIQINPTDIMTQMNTQDFIQLLKELL